ncbi:MAG: AAA family ATPase, partial [Acetobacteraceae bacterium]|nr:AAA family ATPase [Acetobacteraceae bacterium]
MNELSAPALAGLPFPLHLPPEQAVAHPGWVQARTALLDAMRQGRIAVLIGPPGVGKTLLLREVARQLRAEGQAPGFAERGDTAPTDAALPLVDEAEALPDEALQALLARGGPAVLAALPGFLRRLDALATPAVIVPLTPMTAAETRRFVAAIAPPGLFGEDAVAALAVLSQGLPRLAATLGRAAAFQARLEGAGPVTARHVTEAEAMRAGAFPADEHAAEEAQ